MCGATGALVGVAVAGIAATAIESNQQQKAMEGATNSAIGVQEQELQTAQSNTAYSRALGNAADQNLAQLYGLNLNNSGVNLATGAAMPTSGNAGTTPLASALAGGNMLGGASGYYGGSPGVNASGMPTGPGGSIPGTGGAPSVGSQFTATRGGQMIPGVTSLTAPTAGNSGQQSTFGMNPSSAIPGSGTASNNPNYNSFYNTPGFQFSLGLGNQAINRNASATGGLYSTNTLAGLSQYNTGMASQQYQTYISNLMQMAGLGTGASIAGGNQAVQTGGGVSNSYTNQGVANATGVAQTGGAITGLANNQNLLNALGKLATTSGTPSTTTENAGTTGGVVGPPEE